MVPFHLTGRLLLFVLERADLVVVIFDLLFVVAFRRFFLFFQALNFRPLFGQLDFQPFEIGQQQRHLAIYLGLLNATLANGILFGAYPGRFFRLISQIEFLNILLM